MTQSTFARGRYGFGIPPEGTHDPVPARRGDVLPRESQTINLQMSYWIMGMTALATAIAGLSGALN